MHGAMVSAARRRLPARDQSECQAQEEEPMSSLPANELDVDLYKVV